MSTWSQWWLTFNKNKVAKQITWLCGTEPVLMDETVDLLKEVVSPDDINMVYLDARDITERAVWNELRQFPFGSNVNRLTVVRGAENLKNDALFIQYIKDKGAMPRNYVIFISTEESSRRAEDGRLWEPLAYLKGRGFTIECRPFTAVTAKHAVTWVKQKANIHGRVAEYLLNRSTGDLRLVRDTVQKLSVFPGDISLNVVSEMLEERPSDAYLDALFAMEKRTAIRAISDIPSGEYRKTLGLVDARLELAGLVHDMLIQRRTHGEIAKAAGSKGFLVPDMLPVAKHYNKQRRMRIRKFLATLDTFTDYEVPDGALEALVVLW